MYVMSNVASGSHQSCAEIPYVRVPPAQSIAAGVFTLLAVSGLQETLTPPEWLAAALAAAGTVGLGTSSVDPPAGGAAAAVSAPRVLLCAALLLALLGASVAARYRRRQQPRRPAAGGGRAGAYMYGLQAGACFGLSAAACRTGALSPSACRYIEETTQSAEALPLFRHQQPSGGVPDGRLICTAGFLLGSRHVVLVPVGLLASVGLTSSGFVLQTMGLKVCHTACALQAPVCVLILCRRCSMQR